MKRSCQMSRRGPSARKQPYRKGSSRVNMSTGHVYTIIIDDDEQIFYVGRGLTIENLNEGGPYGCYTFYDREEAADKLSELCA